MGDSGEMRGYAHRVDIRAGIGEVWRALSETSRLERWYGRARLDARAGGSYELLAQADLPRLAHVDVFRPPHRLRLIYLSSADFPDRDAVIVDDFLLDRESAAGGDAGAATVLRLLGSGFPEDSAWDRLYLQWRGGWEPALLRLKNLLEQPDAESARNARR